MVHRLIPIFVLCVAGMVRPAGIPPDGGGAPPAGPAPPPDVRFEAGGQALKIPFDDDFGLVFLKVRVNDARSAWFLLDSGFDANILSTGLAKALGVTLTDVQRVPRPGGEIGWDGPRV